MDLQPVVGGGPSDARTEKLGHAGFEIAASVIVLLAGREIGELTRNHDFYGHHRQFGRHTREFDQGFAELFAVFGVLHGYIQR